MMNFTLLFIGAIVHGLGLSVAKQVTAGGGSTYVPPSGPGVGEGYGLLLALTYWV